MIKWKKPSGLEIETNDMEATVVYCESLGWKRVKAMKLPVEPVVLPVGHVAPPVETLEEPQAEAIATPVETPEEPQAAEEPRRRRPPAG